MKLNKIIVTGDMLRPSENGSGSNQKINIDWLYRLLKFPLMQSSGLNVSVLNWETSSSAFDSQKFYQLNNHQSLPADWIEIYNSSDYSATSMNYFKEYFAGALVIGFELPEVFMNMFNALGIIYIDLIIHPVRYLDDIFFGMRTNHSAIFEKLKQHQFHSHNFSIFAGVHSAAVRRMPKTQKLAANAALFTGQVEVDKSLIKDGKILSLLDYQEKFSEIAERYSKVYFKRHPYAEGNEEVEAFLRGFNNVEFIDENFYYLLGQEEIVAVYSISSSTVLEAKYWGKSSSYFYKNPFIFSADDENNFNEDAYVSVFDRFLLPSFWSDILSEVIPTISVAQIALPAKPNRLRNALQNYWGYNFLDFDISFNHSSASSKNIGVQNLQGMTVASILDYLKPEIEKKRKELENKKNTMSLKKPTLFDKYQSSIWKRRVQRIKYIPYLGPSLLYVKHKILKRDGV